MFDVEDPSISNIPESQDMDDEDSSLRLPVTRLGLPGHWSRTQMVMGLIKIIIIGIPI